MAKLNEIQDSDDDFPQLPRLPQRLVPLSKMASDDADFPKPDAEQKQNRELGPKSKRNEAPKKTGSISKDSQHQIFVERDSRKQRPLKLAHVNSLLLPLPTEIRQNQSASTKIPRAKPSPSRAAEASMNNNLVETELRDISSEDDISSIGSLAGFIVSDSSSDEEALPNRQPRKSPQKSPLKSPRRLVTKAERDSSSDRKHAPSSSCPSSSQIIDLTTPKNISSKKTGTKAPGFRDGDGSSEHFVNSFEEPFAELRL